MNKKTIALVSFLSLFAITGTAFAVQIVDPLGGGDFTAILDNIFGEVSKILVALGSIMFIVAGILYLTSGGDPGRTGTARKAMIYAIAGLAIGLAAKGIAEMIMQIIK